MEIVGLVVIVILLTLAMLFFLRFNIGKAQSEKQAFTTALTTTTTAIFYLSIQTQAHSGSKPTTLQTRTVSHTLTVTKVTTLPITLIGKVLILRMVRWPRKYLATTH